MRVPGRMLKEKCLHTPAAARRRPRQDEYADVSRTRRFERRAARDTFIVADYIYVSVFSVGLDGMRIVCISFVPRYRPDCHFALRGDCVLPQRPTAWAWNHFISTRCFRSLFALLHYNQLNRADVVCNIRKCFEINEDGRRKDGLTGMGPGVAQGAAVIDEAGSHEVRKGFSCFHGFLLQNEPARLSPDAVLELKQLGNFLPRGMRVPGRMLKEKCLHTPAAARRRPRQDEYDDVSRRPRLCWCAPRWYAEHDQTCARNFAARLGGV